MATKTKPDGAQSTKPKKATTSSPATDTVHGKRITGAITRSSSSNIGKSTVSNVPHYLRPTQSSRSESPKSGGKKETPSLATKVTKPNSALTIRQSVDKPPQGAQLQRVLFSAGPRSPAMKSLASSSPRTTSSRPTELSKSLSSTSRSRTVNVRPAELVKSNSMPRPGASSRPRSASGSMSRLGTTGKPVKKSPVPDPGPSPERLTVGDSNKQHVTDQAEPEAEPQIVVVEEKAAPPPPPFEDGSVEHDVVVFEEVYVEDEHEEEEEEEEVVVSTVNDEDEHKEVADIPDDSSPDIETSAVAEEEEEEEEEDNHGVEFQKREESHEGEVKGDHERSSKLTPLEYEEVTPNLSLQETLPVEETAVHSAISTEVVESSSTNTKPSKVEIPVPAKMPSLNTHRRAAVEKKESPMYNDVIEETASKLLEKRKNKVRALVGAFETVISLQE